MGRVVSRSLQTALTLLSASTAAIAFFLFGRTGPRSNRGPHTALRRVAGLHILPRGCIARVAWILSMHFAIYNTFYQQRHLLKRSMYKELRTTSFEVWQSAGVAA